MKNTNSLRLLSNNEINMVSGGMFRRIGKELERGGKNLAQAAKDMQDKEVRDRELKRAGDNVAAAAADAATTAAAAARRVANALDRTAGEPPQA